MSGKDKKDFEVGYGRPPKHTRFVKGQSGNLAGRPRKKKPKNALQEGIYPTRAILRADAARAVVIREGDKRTEISMTDAVVRSVGKMAVQGGILAARTYLEYQLAEDERIAAEWERSFAFWREHVAGARAAFARAAQNGKPEPDILPHPDDVEFDYVNRTVRVHGAIDEQQAIIQRKLVKMAHLLLELMEYHREEFEYAEDPEQMRFGIWMYLYVNAMSALPPRLRGISKELELQIIARSSGSFRKWTEHLEARCAELGIPFVKASCAWPGFLLKDLRFLLPDRGGSGS